MTRPADILCIGGAVLDRKFRLDGPWLPGTSNPARSSRSFGGVARNICENLARLGVATALVTRVGADEAGAGLSMSPASIGPVKAMVLNLDAGEAGRFLRRELDADGAAPSFRDKLRRFAEERGVPLQRGWQTVCFLNFKILLTLPIN